MDNTILAKKKWKNSDFNTNGHLRANKIIKKEGNWKHWGKNKVKQERSSKLDKNQQKKIPQKIKKKSKTIIKKDKKKTSKQKDKKKKRKANNKKKNKRNTMLKKANRTTKFSKPSTKKNTKSIKPSKYKEKWVSIRSKLKTKSLKPKGRENRPFTNGRKSRNRQNKVKKITYKKASKQKIIRKKYKNELKKEKVKSNQRNLIPGHGPFPQEYGCDIFGLTKAQSVSRTQLNRAVRVGKKIRLLQGFRAAAGTAFSMIFESLKVATSNGATCRGNQLTDEGVKIFNTLRDCNTTIPDVCDIARITSFNQTVNNTINECIPLLKKYGDDYKVSSNIYILFIVVFPGSHVRHIWRCPKKCVPPNGTPDTNCIKSSSDPAC